MKTVLHILPAVTAPVPDRFPTPFSSAPHPWAEVAAMETMAEVRRYMAEHPGSELHRLGKMFGVLVVRTAEGEYGYLRAFSAMLDGQYHHPGFVAPVYDMAHPPLGRARAESQALQRWLFSQYRVQNGLGETRDLLQLFADRPAILSEEDYYAGRRTSGSGLPPSGAGECCAPKLLQTAYAEHLTPLCMAEFWVGASPKNELRQEGCYYGACLSKCKPILDFMLQGMEVADDPRQQSTRALAEKVEVLYDDAFLSVLNKPAGLLTVPSADGAYCLTDWCREQWPEKEVVAAHRLDQDTSGIVVIAKDKTTLAALQSQFVRRDIKKRYQALLQPNAGIVVPDEGTIDLPLLRNPFDRPRQMVSFEHGKPSLTRFVVRERRPDGTLWVDFFPLTGRTHQLRLHAAHPAGLNAPIVGDRLYGRAGERLMLHAAEISFTHPHTGEEMHFFADFCV